MKLINSLLFALGLVALASRIVATSAAGNPLVVAGRSTAKNGKASIGAVVETNRRLQELQDGKCQKEVKDLTTCVFTNCAEGEECPDHVRFYPTGFLPSPSAAGCDILQKDYCTELTTLGHCCPQCTELTVSYWECFLKDQFLPICQDMSFDCHGTINGGGGDDDDDDDGDDESIKASTDLQDLKGASCLDDLSAVFNCYFEKCPSAECHSDSTAAAAFGDNCDVVQANYCEALSGEGCCPACADPIEKYMSCSGICPEMNYECDARGGGDGRNSNVDTIEDGGMTELGAECDSEASAYFVCALQFCLDSNCSDTSSIEEEEDIDLNDCGTLKDTVCKGYSSQKSCCPECINSYASLLNCSAESEGIGFLCPPLECNGTLVLSSDDTAGESGSDAATDEATCESTVAAYFLCMLGNCSSATCDSIGSSTDESNGAPYEDCGAAESDLCAQFSGHEECCPRCVDAFLSMTNLCAPKEIGEQCSDIYCNGNLVISGCVSFDGSMILSVTILGLFTLGLVVF